MMRYFLLISFVFLGACASSNIQKPHMACEQPVHLNWDSTLVYKASILVMNQNISGLIIFKKENDSTTRLIMTTDVGPKLIDLRLTPRGYSKNYVFKKLNRKALLNMFWEDFGTTLGLFTENRTGSKSGENTCCYPVKKNFSACYLPGSAYSFPSQAYFSENEKTKTKITYFCSNAQQPDSILIVHPGFNMSYFLKKVN
jgi:hypothetical protein